MQSIQKRVQDCLSVPVPVTIRNVDGDIATVIREQAESLQAKWVVMTTHGKGPLARFWLGSTTNELVRSLPIPLVLVHPNVSEPDMLSDPTIKHMLIPLDGTPWAEQILEPALTLGSAMHADFTLLRVITPVYPVTLPAEPAIFGSVATDILDRVEQLHADLKKEAAAYTRRRRRALPQGRPENRHARRRRGSAGCRDLGKRQAADRHDRDRHARSRRLVAVPARQRRGQSDTWFARADLGA